MTTPRHRCLAWAACGAVLGISWNLASGQDVPVAVADPSGLGHFIDVFREVPLPATLAALAYMLGRSGGVPVRVSLSDEDKLWVAAQVRDRS